jgi:hypothetical protein
MQRQSRVEGANAKAKKFGRSVGFREVCASVWKRRGAITRVRESTSVQVTNTLLFLLLLTLGDFPNRDRTAVKTE